MEEHPVVLEADTTKELIDSLKEALRYERGEKERYRALLHQHLGLVTGPELEASKAAPQIHESLPGYKPWSQVRGELEERHRQLKADKQAKEAKSQES